LRQGKNLQLKKNNTATISEEFAVNHEVETVATQWLMSEGISLYDKGLSCGGDFTEMQWDSKTVNYELFLFEAQIHNANCVHYKLTF
jgi:hypothetical protein